MEGLTIRKATPKDTERIAQLIHGEPGQEAVAIAGCVEGARDFGMAMVRLANSPHGWESSVMAELAGEVVGVMQAGPSEDEFQLTPQLALLAVRTFGVGLISIWPRVRARQRVNPRLPAAAYHIFELDVDPQYRNRGIGGTLVDYAEAEARELGYRCLSLTTTTINPARRLYERHGFRVVQTLTDRAYERYTGISGRHLMVKELT